MTLSTHPWHEKSAADVAAHFQTDLEKGPLRSVPQPARPRLLRSSNTRLAFRVLWSQLKGTVILILTAAAIVSIGLGEYGNSIGIGASVLFAVFFGFLTDFRAEKALEALQQLNAPTARVFRSGQEQVIPADDLRPGDLLILGAGEVVAADARLVETRGLSIDESPLTGESAPIAKTLDPLPAETSMADRTNMVFSGSAVVSGYGRAVVTSVGEDTELGRIGKLVIENVKEETPLEKQAEQLGRQLAMLVGGLCAGITLLGLWREQPWVLMIETGVILAIAAIPEGLPAVTTVALAGGVRRMVREKCLVRHLAAVETLGSALVLCADKTGTMTENVMRVVRVLLPGREITVTGQGYDPAGQFLEKNRVIPTASDDHLRELFRASVLCNNARLESHEGWHIHGASTEGALLTLSQKGGMAVDELLSRYTRLAEEAFTSDRKRMTVVARDDSGKTWAFSKGSIEGLLERCSMQRVGGKLEALTPSHRETILSDNVRWAEQGYRMLGVAFRSLSDTWTLEDAETDLVWIGMLSLIDPPRAGVPEAIRTLRAAGVRTVMITGDQKATAMAIAKELGLLLPGFECYDAKELAEHVSKNDWTGLERVAVFARVTPQDKLSIVKALKASGATVGMTGDGINDAPAMKAADIGVAMGATSTDVAKKAADVVITDGNFATLETAVREGRQIYSNLRRAVRFLLLCSLSTIGVMGGAVLAGLPLPMSPLQILWFNLVVHIFPGIALALVPGETGLMQRAPRASGEALLPWSMIRRTAVQSALVAAISLWVFTRALPAGAQNRAQAIVMTTLGVCLLLQALAGLSERETLFEQRRSLTPVLWLALGGGLIFQMIGLYVTPLARILNTMPLTSRDWLMISGYSVAALSAVEGWKLVVRASQYTKPRTS